MSKLYNYIFYLTIWILCTLYILQYFATDSHTKFSKLSKDILPNKGWGIVPSLFIAYEDIDRGLYKPYSQVEKSNPNILVVFLIRTYYGHFDLNQPFNILILLQSLQQQYEKNWIAYMMNSDVIALDFTNNPITQLMLNDSRIRLLDIPVKKKYNKWIAGYDLTDEAIQKLSIFNSSYLVITNGDNFYQPDFLSSMSLSSREYDLYFTDYYSRYERADTKYATTDMSMNQCHAGRLDRGYIDLGGIAISLSKLLSCNIRFMDYGAVNSQDGLFVMSLSLSGWKSKRIPNCAFHHAPNPYGCHQLGGIWYTSASSIDEVGDSCFSKVAAYRFLEHYGNISKLTYSSSGLSLISMIEPYASINKKKLRESNNQFSVEFVKAMRIERRNICESIIKSDYKLNTFDYRILNPDLQNLTDEQLLRHFSHDGCYEVRSLRDYPKGYIKLCAR